MGLPCESLVALIASKRSFLGVSAQVIYPVMFVRAFELAYFALVWKAYGHMGIESAFRYEPLVTMLACKWSLLGMSA